MRHGQDTQETPLVAGKPYKPHKYAIKLIPPHTLNVRTAVEGDRSTINNPDVGGTVHNYFYEQDPDKNTVIFYKLKKDVRTDGSYFVRNRYESIEYQEAQIQTTFILTVAQYNRLVVENDITTTFDSDWFEISRALGIGDALWQAFSFMDNDSTDWVSVTNVWYPLVIGPTVAIANFILQLRHFRQRHGRWPNAQERKPLVMDSSALLFKMILGMLGWEAGILAGNAILPASDPADSCKFTIHNIISGFVLAGLSGLGQGIGVVVANVGEECRKYGKVDSSLWDVVKIFAICVVSGAAWYGLSLLDLQCLLGQGTLGERWGQKAVNAGVGIATTFITVHIIVALMKPINSFKSLYMGTQRLFNCCCCKSASSNSDAGHSRSDANAYGSRADSINF